jgi:hypothetical protein
VVRVSELGRHQCSSAARDAGMLCASRVQERAGQPAMGRTGGGGAAAVLCCCVSAHARRLGVVKSAAMAPRTGAVPNTRQKERQGHVHRIHRFPTPASPPCRAARTSHPTPRRPAVGGVGTWHPVLIGTRLLTVSCMEGPSNPYARRYYLSTASECRASRPGDPECEHAATHPLPTGCCTASARIRWLNCWLRCHATSSSARRRTLQTLLRVGLRIAVCHPTESCAVC